MTYELLEIALVFGIVIVAGIGLLAQRHYYLTNPTIEYVEREIEVPTPIGWTTNRYKPLPYSHYDVEHVNDDNPILYGKTDRFTDVGASQLAVIRYAKKRLGLSGIRCDKTINGKTIELRPRGGKSTVYITHCTNPHCETTRNWLLS